MFINNLKEIQTLKEGEKYSFKCLICGKESIRTNYKNRTAFLTCKGECTSIFKGVKILIEEPLEIITDTDLEEIKKKYKCNQRVEFKCQKCGCKENIQIRVLDKLLCSKCSFEETCLKKFGTTSPLSNKEIQKQIKQTNLKKYGVENPLSNKEIIKKREQTNLKKYGVENIFQSKKFVEKAKQTKIEKYGDENYSNKEQTKQTMLERYGGYTLQSKELLEKVLETKRKKYGKHLEGLTKKAKQTKFERYGDENYNNMELNKQTCLKRYGVDNYSKTAESRKQIKRKYKYDGEYFDSLWELKFYIYALEKSLNIKRDPCSFKYEFDGKEHWYFPDFLVNDRLIEIKGDHFFVGEKMVNPYDRTQDDKFEAKHKCGLKNGVEFWSGEKMKPILEYIDCKYNKDYFEQFRVF